MGNVWGDRHETFTPNERFCSNDEVQRCLERAQAAVEGGAASLAVIMLPGSLNPVHREHIHTLELASQALECEGISVIGGFLQPSSDGYVKHKLGAEAMSLQDRIHACRLAAQSSEMPIGVWCTGDTAGQRAVYECEQYLNKAMKARRNKVSWKNIAILGYYVMGADLLARFGGWQQDVSEEPIVVLRRPGTALPAGKPGPGWYLAKGATSNISSTKIREALSSGSFEAVVAAGCDPLVAEFLYRKRDGACANLGNC